MNIIHTWIPLECRQWNEMSMATLVHEPRGCINRITRVFCIWWLMFSGLAHFLPHFRRDSSILTSTERNLRSWLSWPSTRKQLLTTASPTTQLSYSGSGTHPLSLTRKGGTDSGYTLSEKFITDSLMVCDHSYKYYSPKTPPFPCFCPPKTEKI